MLCKEERYEKEKIGRFICYHTSVLVQPAHVHIWNGHLSARLPTLEQVENYIAMFKRKNTEEEVK